MPQALILRRVDIEVTFFKSRVQQRHGGGACLDKHGYAALQVQPVVGELPPVAIVAQRGVAGVLQGRATWRCR